MELWYLECENKLLWLAMTTDAATSTYIHLKKKNVIISLL